MIEKEPKPIDQTFFELEAGIAIAELVLCAAIKAAEETVQKSQR